MTVMGCDPGIRQMSMNPHWRKRTTERINKREELGDTQQYKWMPQEVRLVTPSSVGGWGPGDRPPLQGRTGRGSPDGGEMQAPD